MFRVRAFLSISAALVLVVPAPAAAASARMVATTISADDLTIYYNFPQQSTQMIHIGGDVDQPITVAFQPGVPPNFLYGSRGGTGCARQGAEYFCPGHGDLMLTYGPNMYDDSTYMLEVTTPDPDGADRGFLHLVSRTDLEIDPQWTGYIDYDSGTTAAFNVRVRVKPLSPYSDGGLRPVLYVAGLDLSLGVPANCLVTDGEAACSLNSRFTDAQFLAFSVPACSAVRTVELTVLVFNVDINEANNNVAVPGLSSPTNCVSPGGTGGGGAGGGGGGIGGGGGPGALASSSSTAPTTSEANASPAATAPTTQSAAPTTASAGNAGRLAGGAVVTAIGIVLAATLGGVGAWWWRRRSRAGGLT